MRLLFKFNLIFLVVFIAGVLGAGKVSYDLLQSNAKEEVLNHARLTMEKALAVRAYTNAVSYTHLTLPTNREV